ncbi:MAG TPA: peptidoglycan-binding domain-containing protein [Chthoniobacterales bacterium]|nr:peptidoglycan-binding domain-containing protein [Chthoniobacterales bacterium]
MKLRTAVLILILPAGMLLADPKIESVQQALKDEGFYYGEVTGNKDADTGAAIRRYQIRNGLQITGDLNDETLKALGVDSSGGRTVVKAPPTAAPGNSDSRAPLKQEPEPEQTEEPTNPMTGQPFPQPQRQGQQPPPQPGDGALQPTENFAGTPYEASPPQVQRDVIVSAQNILAGRGLYRGPIDGSIGPDLEFSLRAYQARVKLPITGRLDLGTLAALELLPGANRRVSIPHRRPEEPVRGQWIRERTP